MTEVTTPENSNSNQTMPEVNILTWFSSDKPFTVEEYDNFKSFIMANVYNFNDFQKFFPAEVISNGGKFKNDPVQALKVAQGYVILEEYNKVLDWISEISSPGVEVIMLKAQTLRNMKQYDKALEAFETAEKAGADQFDVSMEIVCTLRHAEKYEEAMDKIKRASRIGEIRAEYHYQLGRMLSIQGEHQNAINELERATTLDPDHTRASFQLAYICDLYTDSDMAVDYYKKCIDKPVPPVNALLNLSVLYEDRGKYEQAQQCIKAVLASWPNHARARMFAKDIEASMFMYYDEDRERRVDKRNKVLEIPISDFELSVRSRNCLRKMNIRTVGDLLNVTEAELLAYKNFGETSLLEIKQILNSKNLRLGQMVEDNSKSIKSDSGSAQNSEVDNEILNQSIDVLNLSVRSRKCLDRLNIAVLGDLTSRTEAELLGCKNFGMTSLTEVNEKLSEKNLGLRKLDS